MFLFALFQIAFRFPAVRDVADIPAEPDSIITGRNRESGNLEYFVTDDLLVNNDRIYRMSLFVIRSEFFRCRMLHQVKIGLTDNLTFRFTKEFSNRCIGKNVSIVVVLEKRHVRG